MSSWVVMWVVIWVVIWGCHLGLSSGVVTWVVIWGCPGLSSGVVIRVVIWVVIWVNLFNFLWCIRALSVENEMSIEEHVSLIDTARCVVISVGLVELRQLKGRPDFFLPQRTVMHLVVKSKRVVWQKIARFFLPHNPF